MTLTESRQERAERIARERAEAAKERRRAALRKQAADLALKAVGITLAVVIAAVIAALIFKLLIWNLGIVGLAAAIGLSVSKIGFWTALGGVLALTYLSGLVRGNAVAQIKK